MRKARFPQLHTIGEFDFSIQPELRPTLPGSCFCPAFVTRGHNLILQGRTGRGKTHLASASAYRAIQHGSDALFTTTAAPSSTIS